MTPHGRVAAGAFGTANPKHSDRTAAIGSYETCASFDALTWMIVGEVGFALAKDVRAHSSQSGGELAAEGREHRVTTGLSGH